MTMVWIVEDDEAKRAALVGFLKHRGYQVADFTDAEEALAQMEKERPEVIITDLKLPGRDGLELLKDVKSKAPGLPVVIMTAYATVDTAVEAMKLGAYDYLVKPIDLKEVLSVIRRIEQLEQPFDREDLYFLL